MSADETQTKSSNGQPAIKGTYVKPNLTVFGSVSQLTRNGNGTGGDTNGTPGMNMAQQTSDARVKENVVKVGMHPAGFGLYCFYYKPEFRERFGFGRQFGVLAQEVELVIPEAVTMGDDGYRSVNYGRIGVTRADH